MSRRDDINKLYQLSKSVEKIRETLFCANIIMSLIFSYLSDDAYCFSTALVVISFLYMALLVIDDSILWFYAEKARRRNSIQTAYKIEMDRYETKGYYNNKINDPELSYATNQFESVFFTKEISEKMLLGAVIKMLTAITIFIVLCRSKVNSDVVVIVAQTIFSAAVLEDSINMIIFALRIIALYNEAYHEFITVGISKASQIAWLRYFCVEYECIKSYYRIRLNESIFKKMNPKLSEEWESLCEKIRISKSI